MAENLQKTRTSNLWFIEHRILLVLKKSMIKFYSPWNISFSDDFRGYRSLLICLISLDSRSKICRQFLILWEAEAAMLKNWQNSHFFKSTCFAEYRRTTVLGKWNDFRYLSINLWTSFANLMTISKKKKKKKTTNFGCEHFLIITSHIINIIIISSTSNPRNNNLLPFPV